jgi:hypothetical protein
MPHPPRDTVQKSSRSKIENARARWARLNKNFLKDESSTES